MGKTRGRRRDKSKKQEETEETPVFDANQDFVPLDDSRDPEEYTNAHQETTFFGLLDRQELEYLKTIESTLATNALLADERQHFIDNVFEEIKGKELKLATNQICSKLLERLILVASDPQLIQILKAFSGHIFKLSMNKYSSHCLETLLRRSAKHVEEHPGAQIDIDGELNSIENLLVMALEEVEKNIHDMSTNKYSSHVVRLALLILSGLAVDSDTSLRSSKSVAARKFTDMEQINLGERVVPTAFSDLGNEMVNVLVKGQDESSLRRMALDSLGSPLLQILIRVQAKKSTFSLFDLIFPKGSDNFVDHLLDSSTGCHFLEAVIGALPRKKLLSFYQYFSGKTLKLSQRDHAKYVVASLLKSNLGPRQEIVSELLPEISQLVSSGEFALLNAMLEASSEIQRDQIIDGVVKAKQDADIFEVTGTAQALFIETALKHSTSHRAAAVRALTEADDSQKLYSLCTNPVQSHIIEALLNPMVDQVERRKLLNLFVPISVDLACNAYGSHIIDKLAQFSFRLKFVRERIANELVKNEEKVKHSVYGKNVWKNWNLDKYVHKRFEWWNGVKQEEDELALKAPPRQTKQPGKFSSPKQKRTPYDRPKPKAN